ncbi:chaperone [Piromyces finnis]|uniref:Mitochondrial import inner membrane translocase subunit n=1 Tax=Piromyces finnis TaxID=1754191 RepID=A0A1Y1VMN5_9FUNG|nr:chaperone [Piromyces finnis]|eukprot:ORX59871.1 chaperone [Piromyces finnis]
MDFSNLNDYDRKQMEHLIEEKQMKDFMRMYSNLVDRCFDNCVNDFSTKTVTSKENACVNRCVEKFMKLSERASARFAGKYFQNINIIKKYLVMFLRRIILIFNS